MHITIHALAIIMILCVAAFTVRAGSYFQDSQNSVQAKGSVTGRVTVDGKPAQGVIINLNKHEISMKNTIEQAFRSSSGLKTSTDEEGIFHFNDVPAGYYELSPFAPALIDLSESKSSENRSMIKVSEGKVVEGINFALSRGGVITGRVIDAEGRPMIRESISLGGADDSATARRWQSENLSMMMTDDRGVYRIFGLPPGRYIVSTGGGSGAGDFTAARSIPHTYYPGVTDRAKAKVVEVTRGSEAVGIDIKVPAAAKGLYASGRIIDDAGKPAPNVVVIYSAMGQGGETATQFSGNYTASNAKGEFRFDNILPGKYRVSAQVAMQESEFYADPVTMEVKSEDVTGLEIKLRRGASISGIATIEGVNDPEMMSKLSQTFLGASVTGTEPGAMGFARGKISAGGSFRISGLSPGKATITIFSMTGTSDFKLSRIEIDGAEVINSIDIKAGDNIAGVRLVFAIAKGIIHGKVVLSGGKLPDDAILRVRIYKSGTSEPVKSDWDGDTEVDPVGNFVIERLPAGSYDIEVSAEREDSNSGDTLQLGRTRQSVVVTDDAPTETVITLEIKKAG